MVHECSLGGILASLPPSDLPTRDHTHKQGLTQCGASMQRPHGVGLAVLPADIAESNSITKHLLESDTCTLPAPATLTRHILCHGYA